MQTTDFEKEGLLVEELSNEALESICGGRKAIAQSPSEAAFGLGICCIAN